MSRNKLMLLVTNVHAAAKVSKNVSVQKDLSLFFTLILYTLFQNNNNNKQSVTGQKGRAHKNNL